MSLSALLSSFDCNKSSDPSSEDIHRQEPPAKRQKLDDSGGREDAKNDRQEFECDPIANGPESVGSMRGPSDTVPKSADILLTSYKSHYCIEKVSNFLTTPKTVVHPMLGRITTSDTSLIPNDHLDSSNRGAIVSDVISKYTDVICADESLLSGEEIRRIVCAHALQHISLTRQLVLKNTEKLAKKSSGVNQSEGKRDQGFTRPKVLFLLPTRNSCYEVVNIIFSLADRETQENKVRFMEEFGPGTKRKMFPDSKPEDFKAFFRGNSDDMFRIGIKLTRKTIKLFSKFYHSDIIIASPLGLKAIIGATGKEIGDIDFLSSIELLYVDSAEALIMQNWDHVESIAAALNKMPKDSHGCDFSRVRTWYLDGNASRYRQTIISSSFITPEINSLLSRHCTNHAGFIKISGNCSGELSSHIPQLFTRISSEKPSDDPDTRFEYFTQKILPHYKHCGAIEKGGLLIFLSSYLDFVRLRNYLTKVGQSFGEINEYSSASSVARCREFFSTGRHKILLYTERAHHYRRYTLKGVLNVFMYNLPTNPVFYKEMVGFLRNSISSGKTNIEDPTIRGFFTQWDALKMERVVGSVAYEKMKDDGHEIVDFEFP